MEERSPAAFWLVPMSKSSESRKWTLSPPATGDSPMGPTLPKRAPLATSDKDDVHCQVCQRFILENQLQFQSTIALPNRPAWLCLICDECRQKASKFDAVQQKLDKTNQELDGLKMELAAQRDHLLVL